MLVACWSPKGGSGTTVFCAGLALVMARRYGTVTSVVLADLVGDAPAALGLPDPEGPGLSDWLAAGADVPGDALSRLEADAGPGLRLLAAGGTGPAGGSRTGSDDRGDALAGLLASDARPVIADCGAGRCGPELQLVAGATVSIVVLRPCYLALRRALAAPTRPTGAVLVAEPERSLGRLDIEDVLGVPVLAELPVDSAIARAVDAGLLGRRLPRALDGPLRRLADDLVEPELPRAQARRRPYRRRGVAPRMGTS